MKKNILICLFTFLLPLSLYSGEILKQKGKKVIFDIQGEEVRPGDKINVYHQDKRRGVIRVRKLNKSKTKAMGQVVLGKAQKGWLASKEAPSSNEIKGASQVETASTDKEQKLYYGALLGLSMDSMTVSLSNEEVDLSGTGFSVKFGADYLFSSSLQARIRAGAELFSATGEPTIDANCGTGSDCEVDLTYFTLEGMLQYYLTRSDFSFWLGGGGAVVHTLSGSSNAVQVDDIGTTSAIQIGGGLDIKLDSGNYIPLEIIFSSLPESDSVQATYFTFNVGYLF